MNAATPFKWRHFEAEIILLCVRWYLRYALSYRDLEEKYLVSYLLSLNARRMISLNRAYE
jgi:transposase-like protein